MQGQIQPLITEVLLQTRRAFPHGFKAVPMVGVSLRQIVRTGRLRFIDMNDAFSRLPRDGQFSFNLAGFVRFPIVHDGDSVAGLGDDSGKVILKTLFVIEVRDADNQADFFFKRARTFFAARPGSGSLRPLGSFGIRPSGKTPRPVPAPWGLRRPIRKP